MKILRIQSTDLFSKALCGRQSVTDKNQVPTTMDVYSMFGEIQMIIETELEPVELLYLIESDHNFYLSNDDDTQFTVKLNAMDIVYNFPSLGMELLYDDKHTVDDICSDPTVLMLFGQSLGNTAIQRFSTNKFVNKYITNGPDAFNGWSMDLLSINDVAIPPVTPTTKPTIHLNDLFEQQIHREINTFINSDYVCGCSSVHTYYSKRATYQEILELIKQQSSGVKITNISYGIGQLLDEGALTENMYHVSLQRNITGHDFEVYECDFDAVNEVMRTKAIFPVVIDVAGIIDYADGKLSFSKLNQFDNYTSMIMLPNFQSTLDEIGKPEKKPEEHIEEVSTNTEDTSLRVLLNQLINSCAEKGFIATLDMDLQSQIQQITAFIDDLNTNSAQATISEEGTQPVQPKSTLKKKPIRTTKVKFFAEDGTFDTLQKIEQREEYQQEGVVGIVAMKPDDPASERMYYIGHPIQSDVDEVVRYKWSRKTLDEIFSKVDQVEAEQWISSAGEIMDESRILTKDSEVSRYETIEGSEFEEN